MSDTIDKVSERLTGLEVTVAQGFHDVALRFESLEHSVARRFHESELRDLALSRKIDVATESLRGDLKTVLDAVGSLSEEMRRTTDSLRAEHAADRKVLTVTLQQHARRLHDLESR